MPVSHNSPGVSGPILESPYNFTYSVLDHAFDVMPMPFVFKCKVFGLLLLFFVAMVAGENVVVSAALSNSGRMTQFTQCTPGFSNAVHRG